VFGYAYVECKFGYKSGYRSFVEYGDRIPDRDPGSLNPDLDPGSVNLIIIDITKKITYGIISAILLPVLP